MHVYLGRKLATGYVHYIKTPSSLFTSPTAKPRRLVILVNSGTGIGTGVNASANLYSLIETAKANGLEPYAYLREVFTKLPLAATVDDIEALLPDRINDKQNLSH